MILKVPASGSRYNMTASGGALGFQMAGHEQVLLCTACHTEWEFGRYFCHMYSHWIGGKVFI